jgi:hypothetical protein
MNWPSDVDGDVLRRLESIGFDFDQETDIDFNIDFDHWPLSENEIKAVKELYPNSQFCEPDEEDIEEGNLIGYALFHITAKLTYELVMGTQEEVTNKMKLYGGWCESWGVMKY